MAFNERIDDPRRKIPPDRITDENDIVVSDVFLFTLEGRTRLWVVHLYRATRLAIVPVKIRRRIGLRRCDRIKLSACYFRHLFSRTGCRTSVFEICTLFIPCLFCAPVVATKPTTDKTINKNLFMGLFNIVINLISGIQWSLVAELERLDHVQRPLLIFLEMRRSDM